MSTKKEYRSLNFTEKNKLITDRENGMSYDKLAQKYKVAKSTISGIMKRKETIIEKSTWKVSSKQRRVRKAKFEQLEERVYEDFIKLKESPFKVVTNTWITERALQISAELGLVRFMASNRWLQRFKERYNLSAQQSSGESAKVNMDSVQNWLEKNKDVLLKYKPNDIFNCDESGLFFKMLPNKTVHFKGEKCHGGTQSKQRLTVHFTTNMSGTEKLPPLIIGKTRRPRNFPKLQKGKCHFSLSQLGCYYRHNRKAWMDSSLFEEYLKLLQAKFSKENRHILLLLDNFIAHKLNHLNLNNVKLLFLPANTTSVSQPLDQGIIRSFKAHYRKDLLNHYWNLIKVDKVPKEVDVWLAIRLILDAWRKVNSETIHNCFKKALPGIHSNGEDGYDSDATEIEQPFTSDQVEIQPDVVKHFFSSTSQFDDYVQFDDDLLIGDDLAKTNHPDEAMDVDEQSGEEDEEPEEEMISNKQAIDAVLLLLRHSTQNGLGSSPIIANLTSHFNDLTAKTINSKRQSNIDSFFKPISK